MPAISVIIPVHNPGALLQPALESILSQTFRDFEIVVVDDESSEDLSWVTRSFPVRLIRQKHGGASIARNLGIVSTNSEYVAFMDQDDLWKPEKLAYQVQALGSVPEAGVCHCGIEFLYGKDLTPNFSETGSDAGKYFVALDPAGVRPTISPVYASLSYFATAFAVPSSVVIRRTAIAASGLLDPHIPFFGDYDLLVKIGSRHSVLSLPAALTVYRWHDSQYSGNINRRVLEVKVLTDRYAQLGKAIGDRLLQRNAAKFFGNPRKILGCFYFNQSRSHCRQRDYKSLAATLLKASYYDPVYVGRSCAQWILSRLARKAGRF